VETESRRGIEGWKSSQEKRWISEERGPIETFGSLRKGAGEAEALGNHHKAFPGIQEEGRENNGLDGIED